MGRIRRKEVVLSNMTTPPPRLIMRHKTPYVLLAYHNGEKTPESKKLYRNYRGKVTRQRNKGVEVLEHVDNMVSLIRDRYAATWTAYIKKEGA
jgi:hypothetical protein